MSFLAPWGLALGALALPLIGLYFLKIRRQRIRVPSTLLWTELAKTERLATPFQRFQRNLLLLLQLLMLLLVALAFARPFIDTDIEPGRSVVVVLDTSASMGATDGDPTRLADAIVGAKKVIGDLGPEDDAMLVVAGPITEVRVPFTREHRDILDRLDTTAPSEAEASLREGIELALSLSKTRPGVEIVVFSDGGGEDLSTLPVGDASVKFVPVGSGRANAALTAIDVRRSPSSDLDRQLFVTAANYGPAKVDATVEVYLDGKSVGLKNQEMPAGEPVALVFDLPSNADGVIEVKLDTPGDLLPADNHAYAVVTKAAERKVLLSGVDRLTARVLSADPRFDLDLARAPVDAAMASRYDAIVTANPIPDGMSGRNYFAIAPVDGGPVKFGVSAKQPEVTAWRRTHSVLRFVELDGVAFAKAKKVDDQGGLAAIVDGTTGPLVLAGEVGGGRVVQLAFDPFDSDLPLRVAWPVLVLNSVGWITENSGGGDAARVIPTGTPFVRRLPEGVTTARVVGPDNLERASVVSEGVLRVRDTTKVGIYEVTIENRTTRFGANLLSPSESRIAPRGTLDLGGRVVEASTAALKGRREIWRELLLAAVAFLVVEWFAWNRRKHA